MSDKLSSEANAADLGPCWAVGSKVFLNYFLILASASSDPSSEPPSDGSTLEFSRVLWPTGLDSQGAIPDLGPPKSCGRDIPQGPQHAHTIMGNVHCPFFS